MRGERWRRGSGGEVKQWQKRMKGEVCGRERDGHMGIQQAAESAIEYCFVPCTVF